MTIDEAIALFQRFRNESKLGGETCVEVYLDGEVANYVLALEQDADGALVVLALDGPKCTEGDDHA